MPELPEVENIRHGLRNKLKGKKILNVHIYASNLRKPIPQNIKRLISKAIIIEVTRKAKYILISLNNSYTIIMHMGMSGRIRYIQNYDVKYKHDHFILNFDDQSHLVYNDARRFGLIDVIHQDDLACYPPFSKIGIEPMTADLNITSLSKLLCASKNSIKSFLMKSSNIAGIGNIYASEILHYAKISPLRTANLLTTQDIDKLLIAIKKILQLAILAGGSTLKDYMNIDGKIGNFQTQFKIYQQKQCHNCKTKITKIVQNGRSTYFCNICQM